ncbi:MAG TPA: membrane protein insertion efficiency factor YidD [Ktedonobacteraceae bacterium]|nr:membrane protein insertion efficiency factor YidD [Ktedonobacteraceae bacterium]
MVERGTRLIASRWGSSPLIEANRRRTSTVKHIALILIRIYQNTLSVILPSSCRFTPSCSQYGYEAISRFGFFRGGWMTIKRIGRCQPFYKGNLYDPVPERLAD